MKVTDLAYETVSALSTNKVRTLLTILGIVIGISSVIAMTAVIDGMQASLVSELGLNQSRVVNISLTKNDYSSASEDDVSRIERGLSSYYDYITLYNQLMPDVSSPEHESPESLMINACAPEFFDAMGIKVVQGRLFDQEDSNKAAQVIVLDQTANETFFGSKDANSVGKQLSIAGSSYTVVGIAQTMGINFGPGSGYIPYKTGAMRVSGQGMSYGTSIIGYAKEGSDMDVVARATSSYIAALYDVPDTSGPFGAEATDAADAEAAGAGGMGFGTETPQDDSRPGSVSVSTAKQIIDQLESMMSAFRIIATAVASISLLVGGIGIMNMMLTNVTERIREIGLRKALGAHRSDISMQFLLESVTICLIGGALGILFGYGFAWIGALVISTLGAASGSTSAFTPIITPQAVQLASGICIGIGIVFGWYPARRAAKLDPVECLRFQ